MVATIQIILSFTHPSLSPDRAGGFGLFSTVDKVTYRKIRAYSFVDGQKKPLKIPPKHPDREVIIQLARSTKSFPTISRVKKFKQRLSEFGKDIHIEVHKASFEQNQKNRNLPKIKMQRLYP